MKRAVEIQGIETAEQIETIRKVLEEFAQEKIKYCLLRNYEFLLGEPMAVESLDTLVATEDFPKMEVIFRKQGFGKRKPQFSLKHKAYFKHIGTKLVSFDVQVGGIHWNDMRYLDESVLQNRVKKDYFYALSERDTMVMLIVHSILGKRHFKPKYQEILRSLEVDEKYVLPKLAEAFDERVAQKIILQVKQGQFDQVPVKRLVLQFLLKEPRRLFTFSFLFLRWLRWKKFLTLYPLISFIGPDGAGKSTMVEFLCNHLEKSGRKVSWVYTGRGRSHVLPLGRLGRAYKRKEKQLDQSRGTGEKKTAPSLARRTAYNLAAPAFALDLLLRYFLRVMPKRRRGSIVITDRYGTDLFLMKHVPLWYKRLLLVFFPKPTMTFYLYHSAEVLHERRPEESVEELQRQMELFAELKEKLNAVSLLSEDRERNREIVVQKVEKLLLVNWY